MTAGAPSFSQTLASAKIRRHAQFIQLLPSINLNVPFLFISCNFMFNSKPFISYMITVFLHTLIFHYNTKICWFQSRLEVLLDNI